jgi:hypothetical protein
MSLSKGVGTMCTHQPNLENHRARDQVDILPDHPHRKVQIMTRKLSLLLAVVAVLAFAVPSMAGAAKATVEGGLAPVTTKITGTGTDIILRSNLLGFITCATLNLNGEITKNDGTTVEGSGKNVNPTQTGCVNGKKEVKVTEVVVTNIKATEAKAAGETAKGTVSFTSKVDVGELLCEFTGTNVGFTYVSGTQVIDANESAGVVGAPTQCGTAKLTGEFSLERTTDSKALILD